MHVCVTLCCYGKQCWVGWRVEKCWLRYLEQLASSKFTQRAHAQMWPAFRNCALMEIVRRHYRMRIITPPQVLRMFSS